MPRTNTPLQSPSKTSLSPNVRQRGPIMLSSHGSHLELKSHSHSHDDHIHHEGCSHQHHHHDHPHAHHHHHYPESGMSRALDKIGLTALSEKLEHEGRWTLISVACFIVALLAREGGMLFASHCFLAGTFLLSGLPQSVEAICVASSGTIDTHVLTALAVIGTLFLGMAQEGALLVLLFQISHTLEEKFTQRASSSIDQLFKSIPTQATLVVRY